jgi:hypothetical protein
MKNSKRFLLIFSLFFIFPLAAENSLPRGFKDIQLGMNVDEAKEALKKDTDFGYHGERDVSLLPGENRVLIETDSERGLGSNFLTRCWFQFSNDSLYIITINLNRSRIDYYSVFTTLKEKYGEPDNITPQMATWKNDAVTMTLEKPLTLKYIDNEVFKSLQNSSNIAPSGREITQQMFLDKL